MNSLRAAIAVLILLGLVTGLGYPLLVTGLAQVFFRDQANGSLIVRGGTAVGSSLIGQSFDDPRHFWGRLSATAPCAYNAAASSGSNLGPLNPALRAAAEARAKILREADPDNSAPIPVDLVTASGSGLDPHISPAAARYQVTRVARARGMDLSEVNRLVEEHIEGRQLGVLGEPRVNVLRLNLALDEASAGGGPGRARDSRAPAPEQDRH